MTNKKQTKKKRALGYALSLVAFQEVGIGPDESLSEVKEVVAKIRAICEYETGIKLEGYPTKFLEENKKLLMNEKLPYTLLSMVKENKEQRIRENAIDAGYVREEEEE